MARTNERPAHAGAFAIAARVFTACLPGRWIALQAFSHELHHPLPPFAFSDPFAVRAWQQLYSASLAGASVEYGLLNLRAIEPPLRLGSDDFNEEGVQFDDAVWAVGVLKQHGLDLADLSLGMNTDDIKDVPFHSSIRFDN